MTKISKQMISENSRLITKLSTDLYVATVSENLERGYKSISVNPKDNNNRLIPSVYVSGLWEGTPELTISTTSYGSMTTNEHSQFVTLLVQANEEIRLIEKELMEIVK